VKFVKPELLRRSGLAVGENHRLCLSYPQERTPSAAELSFQITAGHHTFPCTEPFSSFCLCSRARRDRHGNLQGYDIVGDIHGHAEPLRRLLEKLGYVENDGVFRHRERKMIFVGDFVDRGPEQREVLRIARSMCDAGVASAVNREASRLPQPSQHNQFGWPTPRHVDDGILPIPSTNRRGFRA
jgi:hypothetical protein